MNDIEHELRREIKFDAQALEEIGLGEMPLSKESVEEMRVRALNLLTALAAYERFAMCRK